MQQHSMGSQAGDKWCITMTINMSLVSIRVLNEDPGDPHPQGFLLIFLLDSQGKKSRIPQFPKSSRKSENQMRNYSSQAPPRGSPSRKTPTFNA